MGSSLNRPDRSGPHEAAYRRNRDYVLKTQDVCGICGRPVDKSLKFPDPWSASLDHIIPIKLGGSPFARSNMQLAHLVCNRTKGARLQDTTQPDPLAPPPPDLNRRLQWSKDWRHYKVEHEVE